MSYNPGDPRGLRGGYNNYNSQRYPGAYAQNNGTHDPNPNGFPQRLVDPRPQQQYRGDAYQVGGYPANRGNPQFTGGSFYTNQPAPQVNSSPNPDVDLISFDDDVSETVSVASSVPMNNSHMPSSDHDDSRSESSADGRHSAASGIMTQRLETRQIVSEFSVTTRTTSSVESLAISTSKMSITNVKPVAAPSRPLYQELIVAPKKEPANRQDKERVMLTTNFYALVVHSKIVYRYDINVTLLRPSGKPNINLAKGPRDDAARTERNAFCVAALRSALEAYRALREGEAFVYDGASIMFSSDSLDYVVKEPLMVNPSNLPPEFRRFLNHYADVSEIAIEVTPCKDTASSFDISKFQAAHNNRDMAHLDRTWKQFFDMLTNQDAISNGRFYNFGAGKLFSNSDRREDARGGQERVRGLNKGIKFIEATREPGRAVAALLLDSKIGQFFKSQQLTRTVCEYMNVNPNQPFPFSSMNGRMNRDWKKVNELVKGLRLTFIDGSHTSFVATGISEAPLSSLTEKDATGALRPVIDRFPSLNPGNTRMHWPAVVMRSRFGPRVVTLYYPMDILMLAPNQRVPKHKLDDNPPRADKPANRFREINRLIEAMNLHAGGRGNNFLRAFGVTLSERPLQVEGFRRARPKIIYGNGQAVPMDNARASWRPSGKYKAPATADTIVLAWSCPIDFANAFRDSVGRMLQERGVQVGNWDWIQVDTGCGDMKLALDKLFDEIKAKKQDYGGSRIVVFFVDTKDTKSHGLLKLYERKNQILTQHVSQEVAIKMIKQNQAQTVSNIINKLNCKLTGLNHSVVPDVYTQNAWITDNKSLIIGYDVAHPPPQIRADILDKKPPLSPSVVGISFNGGPHSESFIGDFHYQEPRKEEVSDHVLIARMKWILQLYTKNRGQLPENIFVIRDGVSEGQYQMVMDREMDAIRQGVEEYCNLTKIHNYSPKYVCVIVTKRHNARFVRETQQGIENPLPGTVVDTAVTRPDMSEFYMQSHRVLQGTGKAPSYVVLVDDLNLSMDQLQSFLLALCFSHQIFEGAISLPEPVYQADEWAKRGNDIWRAFDENFNLRFCKDNGEYSSPPVDFEKMTALLSYWNTSLQESRINA